MPKFVNIPADAPVAEAPTVESLTAAVDEARAEVDKYRKIQAEARATLSRAEFARVKADTDADFIAAIDALAAAEKALGRFRGAGAGQRVAVGAASDTNKA